MGNFKQGFLTVLVITGAMVMSSPAVAESGHKGHGGMHHGMHGHGWMAGLDETQRKQIDKLHLAHKGQMYLLKARIKQAKIELAILIGTDKPDTGAIDKKIGEIVQLKREKMKQKAMHQIEVRKLLNDEQTIKFDMHLLTKASKGKRGGHGRGK